MRIRMLELLTGAAEASGLAVVIDVFRACTVACHALGGGAARILPVDSIEEALALKAALPEAILAGERQCLKPAGFDCGNSPSELAALDLTGRTVIHATSAGTRGIVAAMGSAERVITCSFANMGATARAIAAANPEVVSIVAMGKAGLAPAPEDKLCGMYLANLLQDVPNAFAAIPKFLRGTASAAIFIGDTSIVPEADFDLCLTLDAFDFFIEAVRDDDGRPTLVRRDAPPAPDKPELPAQA